MASQGRSAHAECFAGLTELAVPVVRDGWHVATLWSGQVFRREPSVDDFVRTIAPFRGELCPDEVHEARLAYFARPVVSPESWHLAVSMLHVVATYFGERTDWDPLHDTVRESTVVTRAKEYVRAHRSRPISPADVVAHVRMNQSYFCRRFKKETGQTLSEYIARAHVGVAMELLASTPKRITRIAVMACSRVHRGACGRPSRHGFVTVLPPMGLHQDTIHLFQIDVSGLITHHLDQCAQAEVFGPTQQPLARAHNESKRLGGEGVVPESCAIQFRQNIRVTDFSLIVNFAELAS